VQKRIRELEIRFKFLSAHRRRKLNNDLHKIARKVVDLLYETGHKAIYIGKNVLESKNGINLGKKLNQEFVLYFQKNGGQFRDIKGGGGVSSDADFRTPKKFDVPYFLEALNLSPNF